MCAVHRSMQINEIIQKQQFASGISEIHHITMEPSLAMISHIGKGSFNFKSRLDKHCPNGITPSTCNIKSIHANILHYLFYTAVEYCIEKLKSVTSIATFQ